MSSMSSVFNELYSIIGFESNESKLNVLKAANDTLALVKNRVINSGENEIGGKFSDNKGRTAYSDNPVPVFFFSNKPTRGDNKKKVAKLRKRKGNMASYADWREVNNLKTEHVNFQFTGEMWQGMSVILYGTPDGMLHAEFGSIDKSVSDKIDYNHLRYSGFTNPNENEMAACTYLYSKRLNDFMKRNFQQI